MKRVCQKSKTHPLFRFFIGLRRVNGTFLFHGLRTEFKRIWPYGHWASAIIFGSIAVVMDLCAPALGGVATTVRSSFRLNSVSNPRKVVKVPFIPRNPMNNDTPSFGVYESFPNSFISFHACNPISDRFLQGWCPKYCARHN